MEGALSTQSQRRWRAMVRGVGQGQPWWSAEAERDELILATPLRGIILRS